MNERFNVLKKLSELYGGKIKTPTPKNVYDTIHQFDNFELAEPHFQPTDKDLQEKETPLKS